MAELWVGTMGNALGIQRWGLMNDRQSQEKEMFSCLIVSDYLIKQSSLLNDDQFTILSKIPFNNV